MTTAPAGPPTAPSPGSHPGLGRVLRQVGADSAYLLTGWPLAMAGFVLLVTGFSLGAGLLVLVVGLPVLVASVLVARGLADLERWRIALVEGRAQVPGGYRPAPPDAGPVQRLLAPLGDAQTWRDVLHSLVLWPVATLTWSVALVWWTSALAGLGSVVWSRWDGDGGAAVDVELWGLQVDSGASVLAATALGLLFLVTLPAVLRACTLLQARLGGFLLGGTGGGVPA